MKPKYYALIIFLIAVITQLLAQVNLWETIDQASKPILMPALMAYFLFSVEHKNRLAFYMVLALFFSWLGDVFLMFQDINALYFIFGLISFLIAHILYVYLFRKTNAGFEPRPFTYATGFLFIVYGILLVMMLWPGLAAMKIPVMAYTTVILMMALAALFRRAAGSSLVLIGAVLFVASDSLLAVNKFSEPVLGARFWIMSTYILAQFILTTGMITYFNTKENQDD